MKQAIEDRGGKNIIAEDRPPLRHDLIGGDQQAAAFVPPGDELEEKMRAATLERQIAELVDDEQLRFRININRSLNCPSVSAFDRAARSAVALVKRTECPASTTARPSAIARCVFPTPGAPQIRTFSACPRNRAVASSRTSRWSTEGWN